MKYDGRVFQKPITWERQIRFMVNLYLARKARNGDQDAAELLTAMGVEIKDVVGKSYWPPTENPCIPSSEPEARMPGSM